MTICQLAPAKCSDAVLEAWVGMLPASALATHLPAVCAMDPERRSLPCRATWG